jgi:hypothetical protein
VGIQVDAKFAITLTDSDASVNRSSHWRNPHKNTITS